MMSESIFERLDRTMRERGAAAALAVLAESLATEGRGAELFEARLMQARCELGLPLAAGATLDELPDEPRARLEERYLAACREVGRLLLSRGNLAEAWRYLRVVGERDAVAAALHAREPTEEEVLAWIEIALTEGVAPARGLQWLIDQYGTCQAITSFDAQMHQRPKRQQQEAAAVLVARLHGELSENVREDLRRRGGSTEPAQTEPAQMEPAQVSEIVAAHPELVADDNYHVDTSHLAAVVRFARIVEAPDVLRQALDLARYGARLGKMYHYRAEEPFADVYESHGRFFAAQLGQDVDGAIAYFRDKAAQHAADGGLAPAEAYVALLARVGRPGEAFAEALRLLPAGWRGGVLAPSLAELAQAAGEGERWAALCCERGDVLGYAANLAAAPRQSSP